MAGMLRRLFSRPHAAPGADTAQAQMAQIDALRAANAADAERLLELARGGASDEVRRQAAARLDDPDALAELLADETLAAVAAERLVAVLDPAETVGRALREPLLASAALRSAVLDAGRGSEILDALHDDQSLLQEAALHAHHPEVRLAAVARLRSEAALSAVEREARSRDKRLLRAARTRLERLRGLRAEDAGIGQRLAEISERLDHLADRHYADPDQHRLALREAEHLRRSAAQALERRARLLEEAADYDWQPNDPGTVVERIDAAAERLAALAHAAALADQAASAAQEVRAAASDSLQTTLDGLRSGRIDIVRDMALVRSALNLERQRFASADDRGESGDNAFASRAALLERALAAATALRQIAAPAPVPTLPEPDQLGEDPAGFEAVAGILADAGRQRRRIERELQAIAWPNELAEPAALVALRDQRAALEALEARGAALIKAARNHLEAAIEAIERHVEAGELGAALEARNRARQWLACLPRGTVERDQVRLNALAARVEELKDWREFATAPKREALCEEMEALASDPQPAEAQARAVRALRDEWRKLGAARNATDHRLRERFDAAAERAFAPCRAYFEAQAGQRRANAAIRDRIIDQLTTFAESADWEQVNWKAVETILRTADREWRAAFPVPRNSARQQARRFQHVRRIIDDRLQAEYARNLERLQAIVEEAEALVSQDTPLGARMDAAKALQQRWQGTGPTPPRRNRALWKRFRAACDAVFAEREAARDSSRQAQAARIAAIEQLAAELAEVLAREPRPDDAVMLRDASERFTALTEAERGRDSGLARAIRHFDDLHDRLEARIASARHAARIEALERLIGAADQVARLETRPDLPVAAELEDIRNALDEPARSPLAARLEALDAGKVLEPPSPTARRELCIEVELIAGLESPQDDSALRMQVQVERLSRGMSGRERSDPLTVLENLAARWCALPAGSDRELDERFMAAFTEALADVAR